MNGARTFLLRLGIVVLAQHLGLACVQAQGLRHDVFARPVLETAPPAQPGPGAAADAAPVWSPELRAVAVAGRDSLANVDGAIVPIGGVIDGYRLVEVREREAVFVKGKKRYTLPLRGLTRAQAAPEAQAGVADKAPDSAALAPDSTAQSPDTSGKKGVDNSTRGSQ